MNFGVALRQNSDPDTSRELNTKIARNYLMYSRWYTDPDAPTDF